MISNLKANDEWYRIPTHACEVHQTDDFYLSKEK
jgi:hypothetical protein